MDTDSFLLNGVGVQAGVAYGVVRWMAPSVVFRDLVIDLPEMDEAKQLYDRSANFVESQLIKLAEKSVGEPKAILEAQVQIAKDPALRKKVFSYIDKQVPLLKAIFDSGEEFRVLFERLGGIYAERISDLQDIINRISAAIAGLESPGLPHSDTPYILVADDLAPADTATLDPKVVSGILIAKGGPTCHAAIIARSLEIPTVVAIANLDKVRSGTSVLIDGDSGVVRVGIDGVLAGEVIAASKVNTVSSITVGPSKFRDGEPFSLLVNVGTKREIEQVSAKAVDGVGLFRTEFLYLNRTSEPTLDEQVDYYSMLFDKFEGKSVTVRTIDAGADKPLPFLGLERESNPALGVRGFRVTKSRREVIERQLEAISIAAKDRGAIVSVMAPMISTVAETEEFVSLARSFGLARAGVMVEVPAAVLCADEILSVCDFVSIGTNDLAQYLFAADRESPQLSSLHDPWNVALLRAVEIVAAAGARRGKAVSVCGEVAADPLFSLALIGLGVTSLSVGAASVGKLRAIISRNSRSELSGIVRRAIAITDPKLLKSFISGEVLAAQSL